MSPDTLNEILKAFEHLIDMLQDGYADTEVVEAVEGAKCLLEDLQAE